MSQEGVKPYPGDGSGGGDGGAQQGRELGWTLGSGLFLPLPVSMREGLRGRSPTQALFRGD